MASRYFYHKVTKFQKNDHFKKIMTIFASNSSNL